MRNGTENRKVFIVHGHDHATMTDVARTVERLGLEAVILIEDINAGQTLIEKLESHSDVAFAIVILSPDDEGKAKSETRLKNRARQNVIAELGYFIGKIGRKNVCGLYIDDIEIPSDFSGVLYIRMDSAGSWRYALARELKAAGLNINTDMFF